MTSTILAIGLNATIINELNASEPRNVINATDCNDAIETLQLQEVSTIVLDSNASISVENDLHKLLSATPVTTHIVLITPNTNIRDNQNFSDLGIKTLTAPVHGCDLEPFVD